MTWSWPPPPWAGGRMGGCETHSAGPAHTPGEPPSEPPAPQPQPRRLFLAPDHRPPLAGVKLVRPRPRPDGRYRCGRSSLTHGRAAARNRHLRGKPAHSPHTKPVDTQQVTGPALPRSLDRSFPHGWTICEIPCGYRTGRRVARNQRYTGDRRSLNPSGRITLDTRVIIAN